MGKNSKRKINRRDFIKQSVLAGSSLAFNNPAKIFMAALFSEMISKSANATTVSDQDFNFVNVWMGGGPPRWLFDNPLRPNGSDLFTANPVVGTFFDINLNPIYQTVTDPLFNGIHMPKVWGGAIPRPGGSTTPMANLAPNMLMLRGLDLALDSHELNPRRQLRPAPGGPSLTGLISDASSTPIPGIAYANASNGWDSASFGSIKGLSEVFSYGTNPISDALAPFNAASTLTEISSSQVDAAIDNLFNLMKTASSAKHQFLPTSYQTRASAKALMKKNFGNLQQVFTTLFNKYQSLVNRSFTEAGLRLIGVDDLVLPGSATSNKLNLEPNIRYSGSNFNGIYTANTDIRALAEGMAVAEWLLMNRISSSVNIATASIEGIVFDQLYNYSTATTLTNQSGMSIGLDTHGLGSVGTLAVLTKFYRAQAACMYELINQLKTVTLSNGKNLFQQTVIQLTGDFGRCPRSDFLGSDHAPEASNTTIFSGMITACEVVGNIKKGTNTTYPGTWGIAAPVPENQNRPLQLGNHISTVAALLEIPSPSPNDASVVSKNTAGNAVVNLPRGTNAS